MWAFPGEDNHETLKNTTQTAEGVFTGSNQRYSNEIRRSNTMEASMKYSHTFRNPEKKLIANVSNTFGNDKEDTDITTTTLSETGVLLDTSSVQRTHVYPSSNLFNLSMDYSLPVGGNGLLETGYKGILRYLYSDYERATLVDDTYVIDTLNTNIFEFREHIHAGYIQYTGRQGDKDSPRWKYNAGIRLEQSWNNGETIDLSTDFNNQYFNWFPSGSLSYYTTSENIRLSYKVLPTGSWSYPLRISLIHSINDLVILT
ncbi:MAG: outer membrane beta-barrel protein [Cyclobacteriaceae bacterium]|nr:outer membrane beta-barrel protein [Cyclobacteriaceae bacterium]